MKLYYRKYLFSITMLCVLTYALLFSVAVVFADDAAPPVSTEEAASPETEEPPNEPALADEDAGQPLPAGELTALPEPDASSEEETTDAESPGQLPASDVEEASPDEPLPTTETEASDEPVEIADESVEEAEPVDRVPTETQIVVLVDGQVEPLATQEAADTIATADPIWCPAGSNPGDPGCSDPGTGNSNYDPTSLSSLLTYLKANQPNSDGTIWIEDSYDSSVNDPGATAGSFRLDGATLTTWATHALALQGGWDGALDRAGTLVSGGVSDFSVPIRILNWENTVSINDVNVSNPTTHAITVTTTGDINLHNVTSSNNSNGHGAVLRNDSAGSRGNIKVSGNNNFSNNGNNGLTARSNGSISLQNVLAENNGGNGASLDNSSGSGTVDLSGTNLFNGNGSNGLRAVSKNDITSDTSLTAIDNGGFGANLNTFSGTGAVNLKGTNTFSSNYFTGLYVRAGGSINLENVTASDNSQTGNSDTSRGYGAYLNNRGGLGSITLGGTNVFNHNYTTGLVALSEADITLSNITAGADAATGNGDYGALVNNSAGTGNVSLSGTNLFTGNTTDGLRVISAGNISSSGALTAGNNGQYGILLRNTAGTGSISLAGTIELNENTSDGLRAISNADIGISAGLSATDNDRHGVFLNNSMGAGDIAFTGAGTFSGNRLEGLRAISSGNITSTTGLSAIDNRYGVYLDNTRGAGYMELTGTNTFSDNRRDGLHILSNGDITVRNGAANQNKQSGFYAETTAGQTSLWCGVGKDNGAYGVQAVQNKALYLYGMTFSGNVLGDIYTDGGQISYGDCSGKLYKTKCAQDEKKAAIHSLLVSGVSQQVALYCQTYAGTKLILPNGDFALIPCPIGEYANLTSVLDAVPALPAGSDFVSGLTLEVTAGAQSAVPLNGLITISFVIPEGKPGSELVILFWKGDKWIEVNGTVMDQNHFVAQVDRTGSFVLASK
jgi:hypothetical protein